MPQIHGSKDVHRIFVEDAEQHSWLLGLVALGIFEDRRFDWMRHFEEHNRRIPSEDEVRSWYEQQSQRVLDDVLADAENALRIYAEQILEETIDKIRRETERGVIVSEVRLSRSFWNQLGVNVLGSVVSAFLFAALLAVFVVIVFYDPSPVQMMQNYLNPPVEERNDGRQEQEQQRQ
jgi:hypothetical protein